LTSLSRECNRKASETVREKFQKDIEGKIEEFCNSEGLAFTSYGWIGWRAALRGMAQNLALAYGKLNINPFTNKPPKREFQEFAKLANELARVS
jgi:hypothetical protein